MGWSRRDAPHEANPKVLDLAPTWAPTPGWTVLHCSPRTTPGTVYSTEHEEPAARRFYDHVGAWFADLTAAHPAASAGMAALPPDTLHVTVSDGLSIQHLARVAPAAATSLRSILDQVGTSVEDPDLVTFGHADLLGSLIDLASPPIVYRVTGVVSRGFAVVVALAPDEASVDTIAQVTTARSRLLDAISRSVGADLRTTWRPHVTLGYAIDRTAGAAFDAVVRAESDQFVAEMADQRLVLAGSALFSFDDMVTFRRSSLPRLR
jgi:hypothetical protein